jgi:hypothetical protein
LGSQGQAAPPGAIVVGELAVGVEVAGDAVGDFAQAFGTLMAGPAGQVGLGGIPSGGVDPGGQLVEEAVDDGDVGGADMSAALGGRGGRIPRRQRLAGQRAPGAQRSRVSDTAIGFPAGDAQSVGQHVGERAAEFGWGGLALDLVDQLVACRGQPAHLAFE